MSISKSTLLITFIAFAMTIQIQGQNKSLNTSKGFPLEIPAELKLTEAESKNHDLVYFDHYDTALGGRVYISGIIDSNGSVKLYSIHTPKKAIQMQRNSGCTGGNYNACARDCTTRPNTYGIILCTGYCVIDCIIFED